MASYKHNVVSSTGIFGMRSMRRWPFGYAWYAKYEGGGSMLISKNMPGMSGMRGMQSMRGMRSMSRRRVVL